MITRILLRLGALLLAAAAYCHLLTGHPAQAALSTWVACSVLLLCHHDAKAERSAVLESLTAANSPAPEQLP